MPNTGRTFLVVIDESEELRAAIRFACRRARSTGGRVALLYVIEPTDFQHFASIGDLMRAEARELAEETLHRHAEAVNACSREVPVLFIREGDRREAVLALMDEEPSISILVLAASAGADGPGPLISALTGKFASRLHVPVTIVPGNLSDEAIDCLT